MLLFLFPDRCFALLLRALRFLGCDACRLSGSRFLLRLDLRDSFILPADNVRELIRLGLCHLDLVAEIGVRRFLFFDLLVQSDLIFIESSLLSLQCALLLLLFLLLLLKRSLQR